MKQILTLILITLGIATQAQKKNPPKKYGLLLGAIYDEKGRMVVPSQITQIGKENELEKQKRKQYEKSLSTAQKQVLKENPPKQGSVSYGPIYDRKGRIIVPSEISQRQKRLQQR